MNTAIENILGRLRLLNKKIDPYQGYYMAQCPAHEDQNPSLQLKENQTGKVHLKCHAGCNINDVLKSLNISMKDLYPNYNNMKTETIYSYSDRNGNHIFDIVRKPRKEFYGRMKDENGKYIYKVPDDKKTIYNLPLVLSAINNGDFIFITEGEKDADALINIGLIATTNPFGAGNWKPSYNHHFKGANVFLLPDNDEPGLKHMEKVAQNLTGITISTRTLKLPDLPIGGDISDWLAKGNTKDDLLKLVAATLETNPEDEKSLNPEPKAVNEKDFSATHPFVFKNHHTYKLTGDDEQCVANFTFEIVSVQLDQDRGRLYNIQITELINKQIQTTQSIEIHPDVLDDKRAFNKAIRKHSFGRIFPYSKTQPVELFKWQYEQYDRPEFVRPEKIGYLVATLTKRPFWLFGNAIVCLPWKGKLGEIILKNDNNEFLVDKQTGFLLPEFIHNTDNAGFISKLSVNDADDDLHEFVQTVRTQLINLLTSGQMPKQGELIAKLLLGYVVYMLHEHKLFHVNDSLGHTIMLYVHGPKGTGKSTVFIKILESFFGLFRKKIVSGNDVTIPAYENQLGQLSQMPVTYDEYNPGESRINNQRLNGYYHKSGRSVSNTDKTGQNKYNPINGSPVIISNFPWPSDESAGEATASRMVIFEISKSIFDNKSINAFQDILPNLSRFTLYVLMQLTDKNVTELLQRCRKAYADRIDYFDKLDQSDPDTYQPENRLIDIYTRLEVCYQHLFGLDHSLNELINEELKKRFNKKEQDSVKNKLISQLHYLCSENKLSHGKHYSYKFENDTLCLRLGLIEQVYSENIKTNRIPPKQLKAEIKELLRNTGQVETKNIRWPKEKENGILHSQTSAHHTHIVNIDKSNPDTHHLIYEAFPNPIQN